MFIKMNTNFNYETGAVNPNAVSDYFYPTMDLVMSNGFFIDGIIVTNYNGSVVYTPLPIGKDAVARNIVSNVVNEGKFWLSNELVHPTTGEVLQKYGGSRLNGTKSFATYNTFYQTALYGGTIYSESEVGFTIHGTMLPSTILRLEFDADGEVGHWVEGNDGTNIVPLPKVAYFKAEDLFTVGGIKKTFASIDYTHFKIQSISVMNKFPVDKSNLQKFELNERIANTSAPLEFGIYTDSCRINFIAPRDLILAAQDLLIGSEQEITIKNRAGQAVDKRKHRIKSIEGDANGREWIIETENKIAELKNREYSGIDLSTMPVDSQNIITAVIHILKNELIYVHGIPEEERKAFLMPDGFIAPQKAWDALNMCCQVGMFNVSYRGGAWHLWRTIT